MRFSAKRWAYSPRPIDVSHSAMSFMQALAAHLVRANMLGKRVGRLAADKANHRHRRLLPARRERPCRRAAEERDELTASHCSMPPVLPSERIAQEPQFSCRCLQLVSQRRDYG